MGALIFRRPVAIFLTTLAILVVVVALALLWRGWRYITYSDRPAIVQTERPLDLKDARECPIPLPPTAKNIYYAYYSQFSAYQAFVRCEVPYDDALAHAQKLYRDYAKNAGRMPEASYSSQPIVEKPELRLEPLPELHISWFDIEGIHTGVSFGDLNIGGPLIWIDKDRNLFFYCLTD